MFSLWSALPCRDARGAWFKLWLFMARQVAGCLARSQGFYFLPCSISGFMVLGSGRNCLSARTRATAWPCLWRLSEGMLRLMSLVLVMLLAVAGFVAVYPPYFCTGKHQPQSSGIKLDSWRSKLQLAGFFFFFIHLSYDLWFFLR